MAYKPEDFPIFTQPDEATAEVWLNKLKQYLHNAATAIGICDIKEVTVSIDTLYEIFTRVEKRRVYFHIYHGKMKMGEINEGALIVFWTLKLMPFQAENIPATLLNTKLAYIIFVNLLHFVAKKTKRKVNVKKMLMDNLLYAFQYRDLSKEAIMALVESHLY